MKVGILTYHHTENYGATLQAYALWKTLSAEGFDAELIDYRPYKAIQYYLKELSPVRREPKTKTPRINPRFARNLLKSWKTRQFLNSEMKLSRRRCYSNTHLKNHYQHYDVVVCGSDQIWAINSPIRRFDSSYFLDFIQSEQTKKISYAPSVGELESFGQHKEEITGLLQDFDAISVRDSRTLNLLKSECGRQAVKVLDPTMLIKSYDKLIFKPKEDKPYLLIYNQFGLNSEEKAFIQATAEAKKLSIISIGFSNLIADKNLIGVGIEEWLGYFSQASYIVTNTFHGSIFSILFKKPFNVFVKPGRASKVMDLLGDFGLESRVFVETSEQELMNSQMQDIDFIPVYQRLESRVAESKAYLWNAIAAKHQS